MQRMTQGMYSVSGDDHGVTRCGTQPGLDQREPAKVRIGGESCQTNISTNAKAKANCAQLGF